MWKRKRKAEWLPWYRARTYKGDLTEAEKRQLDAFRAQPKHPAALREDLPREVQDYVNRIELELYDEKQDRLTGRTFCLSLVGVAGLLLNFRGAPIPTIGSYVGYALLVVGPWIYWSYEGKRRGQEFLPSDRTIPNATDEAVRFEWEMEYLFRQRQRQREESSDPQAPP